MRMAIDGDGDKRDSGSEVVERAHGLYREGKHEEALRLYSQALEALDLLEEEEEEERQKMKMKIALHSNRAACFLKMDRFRQAADECTAVLELDHEHTGALMLRAQTLVTLRDYQSALFDVNRLIHINPHSDVYRDLHARLKTQLSLAPIPESEEEEEEALFQPDEDQTQKTQPHFNPPPPPPPPTPPTSLISSDPLLVPSQPSTQIKTNGPWETIPKPKGHSGLDYSRWDKVQDVSSEDESEDDDDDDDEEAGQPQYRFRLRTVSMRPVK